MRRPARLRLPLTLLALAGAGGGTAAVVSAQSPAPDYLASSNVEFVKAIKAPDGLTAGARIVGHYLYVTSAKDLQIFDITKPEDPVQVGDIKVNVQFENEEVPTNGKLLAISSDVASTGTECLTAPPAGLSTEIPGGGGCLRLYDVRNPAAVSELPSVPGAGDHTSTCVLDCSYFYGSDGTITDARRALEPGGRAVKLAQNWRDAVKAQGVKLGRCHNVTEVRPGYLITACQPFEVLSVNPEDGGSITSPKVLATGGNTDGRFIHSARWPRAGADKFALIGGETNFKPQCSKTSGAFMTFDASQAAAGGGFKQLDEVRPINGSYLDSNPPAQVLGCSVHWYEEHPSFADGGLVALAEYGTRFLQVQPDGKIKEQGYFVPLAGSTSAPHWAPNSNILYAIDYERGIDVLRYKGPLYVPGRAEAPGTVPGTEGAQPGPPAASDPGPSSANPTATAPVCAGAAGFTSTTATPKARGLALAVQQRQRAPFTVDVFRQSAGRRITGERLVARFAGRTGPVTWNGRDRAGRKLGSGYYFARFSMRLADGSTDVRRVTLQRSAGAFRVRAPFHLRATCAALSSFKLTRPVFGGADGRALGITYRLTSGADAVTVEALAGGKVVKRFTGAGAQSGRAYRLSLPAGRIARGTQVSVRIVIRRANARTTTTLVSRRL